MKLKNNDDFNYANYLIDNNLLSERENMIWFANYLINECARENNIKLDITFLTNLDIVKETTNDKKFSLKSLFDKRNILGTCKLSSIFSNQNEVNIYTGGKFLRKNQTLEQLLFTCFHELSHAITANSINNDFAIMGQLNYLPLSSKKNYYINKEKKIINLIGQKKYTEMHDFWLIECDADINGGNLLLNIIKDNFSDKPNIIRVKQYVEECIMRAYLILFSQSRDRLLESEDKLIHSNPKLFNQKFLAAEYNNDGSRKNLLQLLEMRRQLRDNLNNKRVDFSYYPNEQYREKWDRRIELVLDNNDELFNEFIYKSIEYLTNEEIMTLLSICNDEDIKFIINSIDNAEFELRERINLITTNYSKEIKFKIDVEKYLLNKLNNCLRLKQVFEFKEMSSRK